MLRALLVLALLVPGTNASAIVLEDEAVEVLADLFAEGGYGRFSTERAAFLVAGRDGSLQCRAWPVDGSFQRASYHGAAPDGTIAIAHTHPNNQPDPSIADHALATRLGIPVLVVTRGGVVAALPGSGRRSVLARGSWYGSALRGARCEPPASGMAVSAR